MNLRYERYEFGTASVCQFLLSYKWDFQYQTHSEAEEEGLGSTTEALRESCSL
jgi:hypothetical protein